MTQFIEMIANVLILVFFFRMSCAEENLTFNRFQLKFNKTYESNTVLNLHKQTFNNNLAKIEEHNKKFQQGLVSYKMEPNQFADLSEAEFSSRLRTWPLNKTLLTNVKEQDISEVNFDDLPKNVDWRDKGIVTSVKNQGNCGSCWAFSTTGLFEGQLALVNGNLTSLSEQQLLDCSTSGGYGCDGGVIQSALNYVAKYGLTTENAYPYQGRQGSCEKNKPVAVSARGYVSISDNETNLKIAVATQGPVSVAVNADLLQFYSGGIFNTSCSTIVDHAVLVVGYGTIGATGAQYWIIKNSWGTAWGENGYYRMAMGVGNGLCGIASQAFYPYGVSNSVESRSNVGSILWQNKIISLLALFAIIITNIL